MRFYLKPRFRFFKILNSWLRLKKSKDNSRWLTHIEDKIFCFSRTSVSFLRVAIWSLTTKGRLPTIWIPSYICEDALVDVIAIGCDIRFYDAGADVNYKSVLNQLRDVQEADLLIYVHYFGNVSGLGLPALAELSKRKRAWLIEDATHIPSPRGLVGKYGNFVCYSPYKHYAIPDGGLLVVREPALLESSFEVNLLAERRAAGSILRNELIELGFDVTASNNGGFFGLFRWLVKEFIRNAVGSFSFNYESTFYVDLNHRKINAHTINSPEMSPISEFFLTHSPPINWERRQLLSLAYRNVVVDICRNLGLEEKIEIVDGSYLFCIKLCEDPDNRIIELSDSLASAGLPVLKWPDLPQEVLDSTDSAVDLYCSTIFLPVNEDISYSRVLLLAPDVSENNQTSDSSYEVISHCSAGVSSILAPYYTVVQSNSYTRARSFSQGSSFFYLGFLKGMEGAKELVLSAHVRSRVVFPFRLNLVSFGPVLDYSRPSSITYLTYLGRKYGNWFSGKALVVSPKTVLDCNSLALMARSGYFRLPVSSWCSSYLLLDTPLSSLRDSFSKKWRNQLVRSEKYTIDIVFSEDKEDLSTISNLNFDYLADIGASTAARSTIDNLIIDNGSQDVSLVCVKAILDGVLIGGVIISIYADEATYLVGWSNSTGRECYVTQLLLWNAITYSHEKGLRSFDLGGIDDVNTPGVAKFKRGVNGIEYLCVGTYIYIPKVFRFFFGL